MRTMIYRDLTNWLIMWFIIGIILMYFFIWLIIVWFMIYHTTSHYVVSLYHHPLTLIHFCTNTLQKHLAMDCFCTGKTRYQEIPISICIHLSLSFTLFLHILVPFVSFIWYLSLINCQANYFYTRNIEIRKYLTA